MSQVTLPGWRIDETGRYPFQRIYAATPTNPIEVTYAIETYVKGRPADATFLGRVLSVRIEHRWDEKKRAWWSTGGLRICLVNPQTGERYKTGWKSHEIPPSWAGEGIENAAAIVQPLLDATRPRTIITVAETEEK